jgi:hypothetical protein
MISLLSLAEVATILKYSESYLRKLCKDGKIRFQQASKYAPIRFRQEWIEEFIEQTTFDPSEDSPAPSPKRGPRRVDEFDRSVFLN